MEILEFFHKHYGTSDGIEYIGDGVYALKLGQYAICLATVRDNGVHWMELEHGMPEKILEIWRSKPKYEAEEQTTSTTLDQVVIVDAKS